MLAQDYYPEGHQGGVGQRSVDKAMLEASRALTNCIRQLTGDLP
jgi:hypothetical protein